MADDVAVTIKVNKNGSYMVDGPVRVIDSEGKEYTTTPGKKIYLCRCGASTKKPFCDGTHSRIGFAAAEQAVPESHE